MKYLVGFYEDEFSCVDEAFFEADSEGELFNKCKDYIDTVLKDYNIVGSKHYKILECSTKGDKRFSAFCAYITINGKTDSIEHFYQNAKRVNSGEVAGKGKPFDYFICPFCGVKFTPEEASNLYKGLWIVYYNKHPELIRYARQFDIFNDMLKGKSTNCQADVIRDIVYNQKRFVNNVKNSYWYRTMASTIKNGRKHD